MMKLTNEAIDEIKAVVKLPLSINEMRQIDALGNLFVSLHKLPEDDDGTAVSNNGTMEYWFQYSLKIDGVYYYFYGGTPIVT